MRKQKFGSGIGYGHRTLKVEQLEGRAMLAGNVGITLAGGTLIITGDNSDNAVLVQEVEDENDNNPDTHAYLITGFDTSITGGGQDAEPEFGGSSARVVHGVRGNIVIDLKKGDDVLGVGNSVDDLLSLAENCGFGLGLGSGSGGGGGSGTSFPTLTAEQPVLEGSLTTPISLIINMGDGDNAVAVIGDIGVNHGAGSLVINGGKNSDNVAVGNITDETTDANINGDLAIVTGNGDDNICVDNATILGALAINAGNGFNLVSADNFDAAAASVVTGKDTDEISLTNFDTDTTVTVSTGNARRGEGDSVLLEDFTAGEGFGPHELPPGGGAVTVVTGNGNDAVQLEDFDANAVTINTGSGNDGNFPVERSGPFQPAFGPISVSSASIWFDLNGNDEIDEDEPLGPLTIVTGTGRDSVEVTSVTALNLTASLGAGIDSMLIEDVFFSTNLIVDAGADNDEVQLEAATIGLITQFTMGAGDHDVLGIFGSSGGSNLAKLIVDGGSGKHDEFDNDLDVDSNGNFDKDENGVPHIIVRNFEIFNDSDLIGTDAVTGKPRKGW